jgi:hypothetical protein
MGPNTDDALRRRLDAGTLTWRGPALMMFARSACAVAGGCRSRLCASIVADSMARRCSMAAFVWDVNRRWMPDAALALTLREGIGLFDLVGLERSRLVRDMLLGIALIPISLVFILGGVYAAGWLFYGALTPPYLLGSLPFPAALYGVLVFPFIWGLTEQMTYNGYLVPRFQVLCRSRSLAVALVASGHFSMLSCR